MNIEYSVSKRALFQESADAYLVFVKQFEENFGESACFRAEDFHELKKLFPHVEQFLKKRSFSGKPSEVVAIPMIIREEHALCVLVGLGSGNSRIQERYRRALASGIKLAISYGADSSIALSLPLEKKSSFSPELVAKETALITEMTTYSFREFFSDADEKKHKHISKLIICANTEYEKEVKAGLEEGKIIGEAVNKVRYFVDMPPSHMTPSIIADHAYKIAQETGISCLIYNYDDIKKLSMGGIHGVSRGSVEEPRFVKLEYKPKNAKNKKPILLVGKGITFDSGGLSLKPAGAMETMKDDMAGAAAVIMTIATAAKLNIPLHIVSLAPLSENMPSGHATKPGDILTFYNGKTAEIKNTDAEGRLILADALSYGIKNYKPEVVIDLATLTGACAHALGPFFSGLFSEHDELVQEITKAGESSGDYVWRLPMGEDYRKAIKSSIADICNIGDSRVKAGGSTAAHFLQHFVGDTPWAHLDIAGSAFDVPGIPYYVPGATGVGVRLLIEFLKQRSM